MAKQYYYDELKHDIRTRGYLVVRGIQDNADESKDKIFRYIAARNAMIAFVDLISECSADFVEEIPRRS